MPASILTLITGLAVRFAVGLFTASEGANWG